MVQKPVDLYNFLSKLIKQDMNKKEPILNSSSCEQKQ